MKIDNAVAEIIVELYLKKDNKILLQKRANTNYEDGNYGFIGGHLQNGESLKQAIIREAKEETGIILKEKDLDCIFIINKTEKNIILILFLKLISLRDVQELWKKKNVLFILQWDVAILLNILNSGSLHLQKI